MTPMSSLHAAEAVAAGPTGVRPTSLDLDRSRALEYGTEGSQAIARVLADYHVRGDGEGGFSWWMKLPIAVRSRQANETDARRWRNRIEFLRDAQREDAVSCAISGRPVLQDAALGCDFPGELSRYLTCISKLPDSRRTELVEAIQTDARARLEQASVHCPKNADAIADASETLRRGMMPLSR